jgi:TolB protein
MQNHKIMTKYIITLTFYFLALTSRAESTIQITKGNIEPIAIAINNFSTTELDDSKLAKDIINVITNDLKGSGVFRPISPAAFIETKTGTGHTPLFAACSK